ncbi:putative glyoxalase/bleomycin resistance protein [Mycolicibacterium anyangense]|uniref:Putative glyoxalase/bleomycin resistance protein n=1 Tax=Mycolicibacterium anyangense TaxID=1431246 RepID=A0A6N4W5E8_9MYCO|nr:VOC family protein [Mycolicibacterium anyangense]BBZ75304.1 putative glyoxalase/bleomycin resistance protein [Mycolicibacterium anyangense]
MSQYNAPVGAPIWFDLVSSDPSRAADFYEDIFGWKLEEPAHPEFGGYRNFTLNGARVAGLAPRMSETGPVNLWSVYLHASDAEATVSAAQAAGATVIVPPMAVGELGSMTVLVDPAGAAVGFWQPGTHPGFTAWGEHGAPYWFECQSKDYEASLAFYRTVLGARIDEIGTGGDPDAVGPDRYGQVFIGESAYSGIMDAASLMPAEVPSFWQVYITVDDVAVTVARSEALGAQLLMPVEDTPYGTLAAIKDPLGALICLGHPPAEMA